MNFFSKIRTFLNKFFSVKDNLPSTETTNCNNPSFNCNVQNVYIIINSHIDINSSVW